MTDAELYAHAVGIAWAAMEIAPTGEVLSELLHAERYFDDVGESVCLAQQLIAEATGLVGVGDT